MNSAARIFIGVLVGIPLAGIGIVAIVSTAIHDDPRLVPSTVAPTHDYVVRNPATKSVHACPSSQALYAYEHVEYGNYHKARVIFEAGECRFIPNDTHVQLIRHDIDDTAISLQGTTLWVDWGSIHEVDVLSR